MACRLFTTAYEEANPARRDELGLCLQLNCAAFDVVTVFAEKVGRPGWFSGFWFVGEDRQQYADLLALARCAHPRDIVVIANSDIIIPRCELAKLVACGVDDAYCITRWDITSTRGICLFEAAHSQDVWVFRGPPKLNIGGMYPVGVPGVDNKFAHELDAAGYTVLNPSRDVRTYHLHLSGHRTSNTAANRVPLPYLYVGPHKLGEQPTYKRPTRVSSRPSQYQV